MEKKEETKEQTIVVESIPQQPVRSGMGEDGKIINLVTREEALTEILETIREIKKKLTG